MNSNSQNVSRQNKFQAGNAQFLHRQPDCSRHGVEGDHYSRNDNALHFPTGGMLENGKCKSYAGANLLDLGQFGRESVEDVRGLHNRDLPACLPHLPRSASCTGLHEDAPESFRARESCAAKSLSWLIHSSSYEQSLETMMEEHDQFRDTIAVSKENRISNRATITPTNPPIDCAGGSIPPDGVATISKFEGAVAGTPSRATEGAFGNDCLHAPSIHSSPSVGLGAFNELARRHILNARNLVSEASSRKFRPAIFYSPIAFGSVSDNSEPKAVRFADVQKFFAGKQNA